MASHRQKCGEKDDGVGSQIPLSGRENPLQSSPHNGLSKGQISFEFLRFIGISTGLGAQSSTSFVSR